MNKNAALLTKALILGTSLTFPAFVLALPYDLCSNLQTCQIQADKGNPEAQFNLADMYDEGLSGVQKDAAKAALWYTKSANQGNISAMMGIGDLYYNGTGVTKDYKIALDWYQKAAEKGSVKGQEYLAYGFEKGEGVAQDFIKAFVWYSKAANQGNVSSMIALGDLYYNGNGIAKDQGQALKWYQQAADLGSALPISLKFFLTCSGTS